MKRIVLLLISSALLGLVSAHADDTCIFYPPGEEVLPNIVLFIDNSEEMLQAVWHDDFDNDVDWTPEGADREIVSLGGGDAFLNSLGYGFYESSSRGESIYYLAPYIDPDGDGIVELDEDQAHAVAGIDNRDGTYSWTFNRRTVTLPVASLDQALGSNNQCLECTEIRYSANYLNWIFFSADLPEDGALRYTGDGSDLKKINRLYASKQALATVLELTENRAKFALYWFDNSADGVSQNKPLGLALDEDGNLDPDYLNSIDGMQAYNYTPLAEGLAEIAGYYDTDAAHVYGCEKNFVILVSPGMSSQDLGGSGNSNDLSLTESQYEPDRLDDYDRDGDIEGLQEGWLKENDALYQIPVGYNGSTYLDDVAYYLYNNDIVSDIEGFQNVITYTIGFMASHENNLFLINTSNNGNGFTNLYDTNNPDYAKYHWNVSNPDDLAEALLAAINSILARKTVFSAPVVPVTRTTSGDKIYLSFFTPKAGNFWEGNVVKFALNEDNVIIDKNGDPATYDNGAIREDAEPFWATVNWAADSLSSSFPAENGIFYSQRPIYTYLGTNTDITASENAFNIDNITPEMLGSPEHTPEEIINYIRGADVFDEDEDNITDENRSVITGDVLHSEPAVYEYIYTEGTLKLDSVTGTFTDGELLIGNRGGRAYANGIGNGVSIKYQELKSPFSAGETITGEVSGATATISVDGLTDRAMIFFGANDGMLHAVKDEDGTASWSFIPPNQLARLKDIVEGMTHNYFVDGSPKLYLVDDDGDGFLDVDGDDNNDGSIDSEPDRVILVCGERKGSHSYFALDVTDPDHPVYLWRVSATNDSPFAPPIQIDNLGESWSEPAFGIVKTGENEVFDEENQEYVAQDIVKPAVIFGGGYSADNSSGRGVYVLDLLSGDTLASFIPSDTETTDAFSFPSAVAVLDTNNNGILDKMYVGDTGGNMYRFGRFTEDDAETLLDFPDSDEDIGHWQSHLFFSVNDKTQFIDSSFFYPPSVTLERGYDLVFMGTGDREHPCDQDTLDGVFVVKDTNGFESYTISDLIPMTAPVDEDQPLPDLDGDGNGWYYVLNSGEKVLSTTTVFNKIFFFTTFTPSSDPCLPGGEARLYALQYKSGLGVFDFNNDGIVDIFLGIGGGIPSRPVLVLNDDPTDTKLLISVGSTNPDAESASQGAGIFTIDPGFEDNFFYMWWRDWVE